MSLTDIIRRNIKDFGPISFKEFMNLALYHEKYGYYRQSTFPAGGNADFVTSPHTCRLFGAIIANQIVEFAHFVFDDGSRPFTIVEMGAGAGYLARDVISALQEFHEDFADYEYCIVEPFEETQKIQKDKLGELSKKASWHKTIHEIEIFSGCVISNELLDSFPVNIIQKEKQGWNELYVDIAPDHDGFVYISMPISDPFLKEYVAGLPDDLPLNYRTEINTDIRQWLSDINDRMDKGFILTIDYGYSREEYLMPHRNRGTLLGYHLQSVVDDVLISPGSIDITAHVNFSDLVRWGENLEFRAIGYAPQYAFLGGLDFENTFKKLYGQIDPFSPEMAAVKMLIMPQAMGESHKVVVQSKGLSYSDINLSGFGFVNHISMLRD